MESQKCPVCAMEIKNSTIISTYKGRNYGFCCPECKSKFKQDPVKFT